MTGGEPLSPVPATEDGTLPQLLFSTRQAHPESSAGFNREIVAESPAVPDLARREMESLADMTGFVLRKPDLPPLWAFRRLAPDLWLLVRAVSLGLYRKGSHQLLAHGVVLRRHHLEWLQGNPFLLAEPEASAAGFAFVESHPDGRRELPPGRLDAAFARVAGGLNRERFARLRESLAGPAAESGDPSFPTLWERLADRGRPIAWIAPPALGEERPDPRFVEWLLHHLHPADRAELSFHGWYAYDSPRRFDLVGVARSDADELRRHLRGEVEIWDPLRPPAAETGAGPGRHLRELRGRGPEALARALGLHYLTVLAPRFRPDLLERNLDVLTPAQADLCLRWSLAGDAVLDEAERAERRKLALRSGNDLLNHAARLAEAWQQGPGAFAARLERHREVPLEVSAEDREATLAGAATAEERWALLALLPRTRPEPEAELLRSEGRRLLNGGKGGFPALLALFREPEAVRLAEAILAPWIEALLAPGEPAPAAHDAATGEGGTARGSAPGATEPEARRPEEVSAFLRFLGAHGRPVLPVAVRFEALLATAPPAARLAGYRELQRACFALGEPPFAFRLLFQRELPLLDEAARRIRTGDGLRRLLGSPGRRRTGGGDGAGGGAGAPGRDGADGWSGAGGRGAPEAGGAADAAGTAWGADEVLAPALTDPVVADAAFRTLADWLADHPGTAAWERCRRLLEHQRPPLPKAAVDAAAAFLAVAALAGHDVAEGIEVLTRGGGRESLVAATADRLAGHLEAGAAPPLRALRLLLDLRNEPGTAAGMGDDAGDEVDRALLGLVRRALLQAPPGAGGDALGRPFLDWLSTLLDDGRLAVLATPHDEWRNLLLDDLLATAAPGAASSSGAAPAATAGWVASARQGGSRRLDVPGGQAPSARQQIAGRQRLAARSDASSWDASSWQAPTGWTGASGPPAPDPAPDPVPDPVPDSRRRAYQLLAWRRWSDSAEADRPTAAAELGLLRPRAGIAPAVHRRHLEQALGAAGLPPRRRKEGHARLAALLPPLAIEATVGSDGRPDGGGPAARGRGPRAQGASRVEGGREPAPPGAAAGTSGHDAKGDAAPASSSPPRRRRRFWNRDSELP